MAPPLGFLQGTIGSPELPKTTIHNTDTVFARQNSIGYLYGIRVVL